MDAIQTAAQIHYQRARTYALVFAGISGFFILLGIADGLLAGAWINPLLGFALLASALIYRAALRPESVRSMSMIFLVVQLVAASAGVHNIAGFLSHAVALYTVVLVGISFILIRWRWIVAATGLTLLTAIGLGVLELLRILPPNKPAAVLLQTTLSFQIFALLSQALVIIAVGAMSVLIMQLMQRRELQLEAARAESAQRSLELTALASQLEATNTQLQATQTELRSTVDALMVTPLPVGDGTLVLPLI